MFVGNYLIIKNKLNNIFFKFILYIFELLSIILVIKFTLNNQFSGNNIFTIIFFLLYSIISFILLIKSSKNVKSDLAILFFFIGICSNGVMLLSPTWGYRTSFATYLFMSISYLIIIDRYIKENKFMNYCIVICNVISMLLYITFYVSVHLQYNYNYEKIKQGIKFGNDSIEIVSYPSFAPCNINPTNDYHMKKFKEYYGINKDSNVILVENNWKFHFIYMKVNK